MLDELKKRLYHIESDLKLLKYDIQNLNKIFVDIKTSNFTSDYIIKRIHCHFCNGSGVNEDYKEKNTSVSSVFIEDLGIKESNRLHREKYKCEKCDGKGYSKIKIVTLSDIEE